MFAMYNDRKFAFRPCDTAAKGMTQDELQKLVTETGYMQYEKNMAWLIVKNVGYGWEVENKD